MSDGRAECPTCQGSGVQEHRLHGIWPNGEACIEPIRCEACDGIGADMTKDEAVAQMFASRAKVLENESDAQRAALLDALESILEITREQHFIRGADSKLYEVGTIARLAIMKATGEAP